eukprot:TRINITY_DN775_c0_g1_i1.p2 TRINITY_DN775_c0_g1~~TRINITY_DN775_c0_g1_i1.p2  ORF type:complete len:156 (-),score=50.85 TRINITY_DN775_c0_g1_i1:28-468(-)
MLGRVFLGVQLRARLPVIGTKTMGLPARWSSVETQSSSTGASSLLPQPTGPTGWTPPVPALSKDLPYQVERAGRHRTNFPVYLDYKNGNTRTITILRKITGDANALAEDIRAALGPSALVSIHPGRIQITGNQKIKLLGWLKNKGF